MDFIIKLKLLPNRTLNSNIIDLYCYFCYYLDVKEYYLKAIILQSKLYINYNGNSKWLQLWEYKIYYIKLIVFKIMIWSFHYIKCTVY